MPADPDLQPVCLLLYTLDSPLVLLPGILYNVSFPRLKAAAFLARYRTHAARVPAVQAVLAEYDFDAAAAGIPVLSPAAAAGIAAFREAEASVHLRSGEPRDADPAAGLDWLVVAVFPNLARISRAPPAQTAATATVCRVVGIADDANTVRLTLQAIVRAVDAERRPEAGAPKRRGGSVASTPNERVFAVSWQHESAAAAQHSAVFQASATALFALLNKFVEAYRAALAGAESSPDMLTLNPLANALFMQVAGLKDFDKAYATLQRICGSAASDLAAQLLRLVDLTGAIVPFPSAEKLRILQCATLDERTRVAAEIADKMASVFETVAENSARATRWYHGEASNTQKANLVANQLKSIRVVLEGLSSKKTPGSALQKQLTRRRNGAGIPLSNGSKGPPGRRGAGPGDGDDDDDDDDDLHLIADFIKNRLPRITSISSDSKRLLVKDFRRIKNAQPGNADFHVIRNYLEIVADMPWDKHVARFRSNQEIDIADARSRLDADHHGLQHVKTRLLQYLVVLKLLAANAAQEYRDSGMQEAEEARRKHQQMDALKFTRESTNGESIIVPSQAESKATQEAKEAAETEEAQGETPQSSTENDQSFKALLVAKNNRSPIILLAGPPGVGKTSLAKSIATTLGRNFQRISLGGVRDESEIRGHRRTYIGAMAGSIVQALRKSRSMNPVILLDEIDKVVGGHNSGNKANGDPAAALLEVLDPEQNSQFVDHFLGFPIDLSQVIFICTANEPHALSRPLLDRLEMIEVGAYDYTEKLVIGSTYLLPRQMKRNGLPAQDKVLISGNVMKKIILEYTREAGVRNLERTLGTICRYKAVEYSESLADPLKVFQPEVEEFDLPRYIGLPLPSLSNRVVELPIMSSRYGVVNGLSYNTDGSGSVLIFESIGFEGKGQTSLNMTGRLGEVLMESAKIGLTFIKNALYKRLLNLEDQEVLVKHLNSLEIHMHVPSGAVQKDGPSAGITMALLFLSLILQKPVPSNIAMTGEITLRGLVLPIGGLQEKVLGAHLTGQIDKVIVPRENRRDVLEQYVQKINDPSRLNGLLKDDAAAAFKDLSPEDYFAEKYGVRIVYAREFWDVIKHVWGEELLANVEHSRLDEYHL